jgi:putative membrane protein
MTHPRFLTLTAMLAAFGATASAQAQTTPIPPPAKDFAMMAAQSDQYEIQAGRTAQAQATRPEIRDFARRMINEHGRTSQALKQAAAASGLPPPPEVMGGDQSRWLASLQGLTGPEFDRAYMRQQVLAHTEALVVQQSYAQAGKDPNLRRAAQSAVPLIQSHLQMAQKLAQAVGAGS